MHRKSKAVARPKRSCAGSAVGDSLGRLLAVIGRDRLLTPEEAEAAGYFSLPVVARELGMSRIQTQRIMYELIDAGSVARVKVSGRGGGYYYGAATKNK